jgi:hypothetical protein
VVVVTAAACSNRAPEDVVDVEEEQLDEFKVNDSYK